MKHFLTHVTTTYDGMEWGQAVLVTAPHGEAAERLVGQHDWTHSFDSDDGLGSSGETQEVGTPREVPPEHFAVLKLYLMHVDAQGTLHFTADEKGEIS